MRPTGRTIIAGFQMHKRFFRQAALALLVAAAFASFPAHATINNNTTINVAGGGSLSDSGDINNLSGGIINFNGPASMTFSSGTNTIANDGQINLNGGNVVVTGNISGSGSLNFDSGEMESSQLTASFANAIGLGSGGGTLRAVGSSQELTFSGAITGGGILHLVGPGTIILSGGSSYSGGTTINGGTVSLVNDNAFGTGDVTFLGDSTLRMATNISITNNLNLGSHNVTVASDVFDSTFSGDISGTGGLTKTETGSLTVSGTNDYSGTTQVNAGTFRAGAQDTFSYWSVVNVASGATVDINGFRNYAFGLEGAGTVLNNGASEATLWLGGNSSADHTFSGSLQDGSQVLNVYSWGGGTQTLSGSNTYSGLTTVQYGTLRAGAANAFSPNSILDVVGDSGLKGHVDLNGYDQTVAGLSGGSNVTNNGSANATLTVNNSSNTTYAGVLEDGSTNTLALTKNGSGTLSLTGTNTYSGGTLIAAGILAISNASALGTGDVTLTAGALETTADMTIANAFHLNPSGAPGFQADSSTAIFTGLIDGTNDLNIGDGSGGVVALAHANSYTGNTVLLSGAILRYDNAQAFGTGQVLIDGGTLRTGGAFTLANPVLLDGFGGTLDTNNFNTTYSGVVSGVGDFTKDGAGTLTLNGINTYTGSTAINAGTLAIGDASHPDAAITSNVNVGAAGTLQGHGTVTGNVTNSSGTVAPGGSIGTLTVTGNYTQGSSGTLAIEVSPAAASKIAVSGIATLNGTLALTFTTGTYTSKTYTVVTAGTVAGTFANVTGSAPAGFILSDLNYSATAVTFDLQATAPTNSGFYNAFASSAIDGGHQAGDTLFNHLNGGDSTQSQNNNISFASFADSGFGGSENIQGGLRGIARSMPQVMKQNGGWFTGTGNLASVDSSAGASGFSSETGGFMFGMDRAVAKGLRIGAAGGYDYTHFTAANAANTDGESNTIRFALYGGKVMENGMEADAQIGYALHKISANRFEPNNSLIAKSEHDAHEISTGFQLSKPLDVNGVAVRPKAGLGFVHLAEDGYSETGAGAFNANINAQDTDSLRLYTGFSVSRAFTTDTGMVVVPETHAQYAYETLDTNNATSGSLLGTTFTSNGVKPSRSMLSVGFGASARLSNTLDAFGGYEVNLPTGNTFKQTFSAGVKFRF